MDNDLHWRKPTFFLNIFRKKSRRFGFEAAISLLGCGAFINIAWLRRSPPKLV